MRFDLQEKFHSPQQPFIGLLCYGGPELSQTGHKGSETQLSVPPRGKDLHGAAASVSSPWHFLSRWSQGVSNFPARLTTSDSASGKLISVTLQEELG